MWRMRQCRRSRTGQVGAGWPLYWLLSLALPADAGVVGFAAIRPGAGIQLQEVVSIRERRFESLVRQQTDFSCGAAALATLLRFGLELPVSEETVLQGLWSVSDPQLVQERGFSLLDMAQYLRLHGLEGRGFQVAPARLQHLRIPVIVLLDIKGYRHFVVLIRARGDQVELADPALGNRTLTLDQFVEGWNGVVFAVLGRAFEADSELLRERPVVSAGQLREVLEPPMRAEALDFGLRPVDFLNF